MRIIYFTLFFSCLLPGLSAADEKGFVGWSSSAQNGAASADYAWSSGCKKDCNDEVDYRPIITIDCSKKASTANIVFWALGEEHDVEQRQDILVRIDNRTTKILAKGASKMDGISLDARLSLKHSLFREMASGRAMSFGSARNGTTNTASLKGSGKAIRKMLAACQ